MLNNSRKRLSVATSIGLIASMIGIWTFVSGRSSLPELLQILGRTPESKRTVRWDAANLPCLPSTWVAVDVPQTLLDSNPTLDWVKYTDDHCKLSADRLMIAFRRCSGFDTYGEPLFCLAYFGDLRQPRSLHARPLATEKLGTKANFFPVGFVTGSLIVAEPGTAYRYDIQTQQRHVLAGDAWSISVEPGGDEIAFLTSFRSGEPNLHTILINGTGLRQRTHLKGCQPGPATLWPDWDKNVILFEMQCTPEPHVINTWKIDLRTGVVGRYTRGQIHG